MSDIKTYTIYVQAASFPSIVWYVVDLNTSMYSSRSFNTIFLMSLDSTLLVKWGFLFYLFFQICLLYMRESVHTHLGPPWSWLYSSWIYNYICNHYISQLKLGVRIPLMSRCTRYNIMWFYFDSFVYYYLYVVIRKIDFFVVCKSS